METKGQGRLGGEAILADLTLGQGQHIYFSEKCRFSFQKPSATTRLE